MFLIYALLGPFIFSGVYVGAMPCGKNMFRCFLCCEVCADAILSIFMICSFDPVRCKGYKKKNKLTVFQTNKKNPSQFGRFSWCWNKFCFGFRKKCVNFLSICKLQVNAAALKVLGSIDVPIMLSTQTIVFLRNLLTVSQYM